MNDNLLKRYIHSSWFTDTVPFLFVWGTDRLAKNWATGLEAPIRDYSPFIFEVHYNHGILLGSFSQLPQELRLVTLISLGALVLCSYFFLRNILPVKSAFLKLGITFQVAGIIGNVTDRILGSGGVIDFISFESQMMKLPVWNLADMFQVLSYGFILIGCWQDSRNFWFKKDRRKSFWINSHFQSRFVLMLVSSGLSVGAISAVTSYVFLKSTLATFAPTSHETESYLRVYMATAGFNIFCSGLLLFALGKFVSNKIAGPLYAMNRFIQNTLEGRSTFFRLRENDEFKELEKPLTELNRRLNGNPKLTLVESDEPPPHDHLSQDEAA